MGCGRILARNRDRKSSKADCFYADCRGRTPRYRKIMKRTMDRHIRIFVEEKAKEDARKAKEDARKNELSKSAASWDAIARLHADSETTHLIAAWEANKAAATCYSELAKVAGNEAERVYTAFCEHRAMCYITEASKATALAANA